MQQRALSLALTKAGLSAEQLQYIFAGDLLNPCIASGFSLRDSGIPFFGLYGACSTMAESLAMAAMAIDGDFDQSAAAIPPTYDTLQTHFADTCHSSGTMTSLLPATWAFGGHQVVTEFFKQDGLDIAANHTGRGILLFSLEQDVHAGASGCGCAVSVLCGHLLPGLCAGHWKRILFAATGALLSSVSTLQGGIPAICHALSICAERSF